MVSIDESAVLWSAPERERADRPLLVLLHGYGSHEGDLFSLSPMLPLSPVIASVRAPHSMGPGFAWFPIEGESRIDDANESTDALLEWLGTLSFTSVGVIGFSQGGAMALQLLRRAPSRFSYAAVLSGFALSGALPGDADLASSPPPVFWGRGTHDQVINPAYISFTQEWLPAHSVLTERIYEGLPHSISAPELADLAAFVRDQLAE
jgi:phospholipase/carboxylesterase